MKNTIIAATMMTAIATGAAAQEAPAPMICQTGNQAPFITNFTNFISGHEAVLSEDGKMIHFTKHNHDYGAISVVRIDTGTADALYAGNFTTGTVVTKWINIEYNSVSDTVYRCTALSHAQEEYAQ